MNNYIFNLFFSLSNLVWIKDASILLSDTITYLLVVCVIVFIFYKKEFIFRNLILLSTVTVGSWVVSKILKSIFHINRPFVAMNFTPIVPESGFSFPSSHATVCMALVVLAFSFNKKLGMLFLVLSILIGASRMVLGVHYPTDILGGFILGAVFGLIIVRFFKKYL